MALITPDVETSLDTEYYFFFVGHGLILIGVFYAVIALNTRPTLKETHQVTFLTLFVLLPAIYLANFVLGEIPPGSASEQFITNYWYLMTWAAQRLSMLISRGKHWQMPISKCTPCL